jgi:hypothetical protein
MSALAVGAGLVPLLWVTGVDHNKGAATFQDKYDVTVTERWVNTDADQQFGCRRDAKRRVFVVR